MTSTSFVYTELANTMKYGEGSYKTLFSPSEITAFHRMKYVGGDVIALFSPNDVTAFHRILIILLVNEPVHTRRRTSHRMWLNRESTAAISLW